jgi:hypothetical protein
MMKFRRFVLPVVITTALAVGGASCFASFAATRKLYKFNQDISGNKFVQTLVMWGLIIIPAYELFAFGDWLIFNTIEFWTGSNVLADNGLPGDTRVAGVEVQPQDDSAVQLRRGAETFDVVALDPRHLEIRANDRLLGTAEIQEDGGVVLFDANGQVQRTLLAADVDALKAQAAQLQTGI